MTIVWDDSRMDLPMSVTLTPQEIEALQFAVSVASEHSAEGLTLRASQVAARLLRGSRAFLEVTKDRPSE